MKKPDVLRRGFTLIELLVVVMIIVILSGMLFKIAGMVSEKAARANAVSDIGNIENALNEYYSAYGMYPPTSDNCYVFECKAKQPVALQQYLAQPAHNTPGIPGFVTDAEFRISDSQYGSAIDRAVGYEYGLVSYLWLRARGDQPHWYDADTAPRDVQAKTRWAHYLEDVVLAEGYVPLEFELEESVQLYSNRVASVVDPWGREYSYSSTYPYQTYTLWSEGPTLSPEDDINHDSYSE